jgi:hypothetical protein
VDSFNQSLRTSHLFARAIEVSHYRGLGDHAVSGGRCCGPDRRAGCEGAGADTRGSIAETWGGAQRREAVGDFRTENGVLSRE